MTDVEERLRARLREDPVDVPLDEDAVLGTGRSIVRARRIGWAVTGCAALVAVASLAVTLVPRSVPAVPAPGPGASATAGPGSASPLNGVVWTLSEKSGKWAGTDPDLTLRVQGDHVSGWSGCGDYVGALARDGDSWTFSKVTIVSPIPCPSSNSDRMQHFMERLDAVTSATTDAGLLTLHSPAGDLVFTAGTR
jgi:heat shock protein HslJ